MRACLDIQSAIAQRAGVGRYTKRLAENLSALRGDDTLALFYFDFQRRGMPFPVPGAEQEACRWIPGRLAQQAWSAFGAPAFDSFSGPADVFHFPNFIRPPLSTGKSVVTIHDLAFLRFPESIEKKNYLHLTSQIQQTIEKSDAIIAVSEFTAQEIRELLPTAAKKVTAIHSGIQHFERIPDFADAAASRKMLNLEKPYLLSLSTIEPRKNFAFLIEVFERLSHFDGDLVIAGGRGWNYEPILQRMRSSRHANRIRYLEYVNEDLLGGLYAGAELFVFPSLYEGFGFTPLEAMARGTPVVSSAGGSLPEVLGSAAVIVHDFQSGAWAAEIESLLGDSARRTALRNAGLEQVKKFSWQETARQTWAVYRKI